MGANNMIGNKILFRNAGFVVSKFNRYNIILILIFFSLQNTFTQPVPTPTPERELIGQGWDTTADENTWVKNSFVPDMSNTTQAFSYFNFFWYMKKEDTPEDEYTKRDGQIRYILDSTGKLFFNIDFGATVENDRKIKDRFVFNIDNIQDNWFYFPTEGRLFQNQDKSAAGDPKSAERYQGVAVYNVGTSDNPIINIAAKGNRIFAQTRDGNLWMAIVSDTALSAYFRHDPHGSTAWDDSIRRTYEDKAKRHFPDYWEGVVFKDCITVMVERPFLWYQLEMPNLQYTTDDGHVISDTVLDIAVNEMFPKTWYDRRYNADYHLSKDVTPLGGKETKRDGMSKYQFFYEGQATFYIFVKKTLDGIPSGYALRWTDDQSYFMKSYNGSGNWRDLDLRDSGWLKAGDIRVDTSSPTFKEMDIQKLLALCLNFTPGQFVYENMMAFIRISNEPLALTLLGDEPDLFLMGLKSKIAE